MLRAPQIRPQKSLIRNRVSKSLGNARYTNTRICLRLDYKTSRQRSGALAAQRPIHINLWQRVNSFIKMSCSSGKLQRVKETELLPSPAYQALRLPNWIRLVQESLSKLISRCCERIRKCEWAIGCEDNVVRALPTPRHPSINARFVSLLNPFILIVN